MQDERDEIYAAKQLPDAQHIRVFDIELAEDFNEIIRGHLRVVPLDTFPSDKDNEQYQTLSYAWGTFENCRLILCDDRPLTITNDLDQALRRIRQRIRPNGNFIRTLWIDAICINQDDSEEKSMQVSIMGQIYQNSAGLIVWLGEAGMLTADEIRTALREPHLQTSKGCLRALAERPWFGRRWILQEVFRSPLWKRYVLLGNFQCYLDALLIVVRVIRRKKTAPVLRAFKTSNPEDDGTLFPREGIRDVHPQNKEKLPSIMSNILTSRGSRCSVPHDYIFALLSLSREVIPVDYNQSLESLNISVARQIVIHQHQGEEERLTVLFVLTQMWRKSTGAKMRLPSWIPHWPDLDKLSVSTINDLQRLRGRFKRRL